MASPPTTSPNPRLPALAQGRILRVETPGSGEESLTGAGNSEFGGLVSRALTFQYNPEIITRGRAGRWEARSRRNRNVPTPQDDRARSGSGSAQLLAESETISLKVVFDATEQLLSNEAPHGVLPELAFLELVSMGQSRTGRRNSGENARAVRPDELLLVLGPRTFPVVLTNLTITEQKFAPDLTPIRAEADLRFNMLEPVDVSLNTWVEQAFNQVVRGRQTLSRSVESALSVTDALNGALNPTAGQTNTTPGDALPANNQAELES